MLQSVRNYGSCSATYAHQSGLLFISIGGHLSDADNQEIRSDAYTLSNQINHLGALVDLVRSDFCVTSNTIIQQLDELAALDQSLLKPAAFVVAKRDLGLFQELSARMAKLGIVAAAFTNKAEAANFALRTGEVWRAEQSFRCARRAATLPQRLSST